MEAIGCLVPELQSEMRSAPYTIVSRKFTRVLVKKQLENQQRQLGKTAVVKVGAYIVSMDRRTTVYRRNGNL